MNTAVETHYFDLTADQNGLYDLVSFLPINSLNLSVRIDIKSDFDEAKALDALRLTVERIPFCNIRLHKNADGTTVQYISNAPAEGVELVDMSSSTDKKVDAYVQKLGKQPFANGAIEVPLYNFKLIKKPDGKYAIFFCAFHIIMDAYSLMFTITQFDRIYSALMNGTALPEIRNTTEKLVADTAKYVSSDKLTRDHEYFYKVFETEPQFTSVNGLGSHEFVKGKKYGKPQNLTQLHCDSVKLPMRKELLDRLSADSAETHVSTFVYVMLALRCYLAKVCETDDVTICTTAARRATLTQKYGGMTFAHMLECRSIFPEDMSFADALTALNNLQNEVYKHAGAYTTEYEKVVKAKHGIPADHLYRSVVLTYQKHVDLASADLRFDAKYINTGMAAYPLYINAMPADESGDLWFEYIYAVNYVKPKNLEKLHSFILSFLQNGMEHPEASIGSLMTQSV